MTMAQAEAALPSRIARARLRRRTEHRLVAGVAGGVADRLAAPVALVRFFVVLAAVASPWVIAAYAGAALLLPARGRDRPDWDNLVAATRLGLVFAGPWLAGTQPYLGETTEGSAGWFIASYGLLAVAAAVMLSSDYRRGRPRSREETRATVLGAVPVATCAVLIAAGVLLLPDLRWERVVPLGALAGGVALLVAGRREYLAPAMLALAAAVVVVVSGARLDGGVGDVRLAPRDPDGEPIVVRRAAGDVEIDLSQLPRSAGAVEIDASLGIGTVEVILPPGTPVHLDARVGRGSIEPFGLVRGDVVHGFDVRLDREDRISAGRPGREPVWIRAEVGVGNVAIAQGLP